MAGFYPDVPAPRMAYDRDGTVVERAELNGSSVTVLSQAIAQNLNDENAGTTYVAGGDNTNVGIVLIFPQLRDIVGYHASYSSNNSTGTAVETSINTTNGIDGTWVGHGSMVNGGSNSVSMRTGVNSVTFSGKKAIRFRSNGGNNHLYSPAHFHVYGTIAAGETPDRLRIWHPTLDEPLDDNTSADGAHLDWGDVTRSTTADKTFRIKNNSPALTANSIALSPQVLTDTSPTVASQMTLSDGGAFTGSLNIGNLAPNTISSVITIRRTIASNATLSLWTGRISVNPGSWT